MAAIGLDPARVVGGITSELGYVPVDVGNAQVNGIKFNTIRGIGLSGRVVDRGPSLHRQKVIRLWRKSSSAFGEIRTFCTCRMP